MTDMIRDWNPDDGDAYQGDVCLFRLPDGFKFKQDDEIAPRDNRLILAEGEVTGHHHAITLEERPSVTRAETDGMLDKIVVSGRKRRTRAAWARMYRDHDAVAKLVNGGELGTADLAIGFLVVEGQPVVLRHDEHDAIRIPAGRYYVGAQREMDASAERRIQD